MKKKFLILIAMLILGGLVLSACSSGSSTTRGTVQSINNQPIQDAFIYINGNKRTTTDSNGEFWLSGIDESKVEIQVRKDNFKDYIDIISQKDSPLNIKLKLENESNAYITGSISINNSTKYDESDFPNPGNIWSSSNEIEYVEDEIIVKYSDNDTVITLSNDPKVRSLRNKSEIKTHGSKIIKYKTSENDDLDELINYLQDKPGIEYAEKNYKIYAQAQPNDEFYNKQWNLVNANFEAAWDIQKHSELITVAVIDSGVLTEHPDLSDNLLEGANFIGDNEDRVDPAEFFPTDYDETDRTSKNDGGSHGTLVAGIIGGMTNNGMGISGVSWDIDIIPIKALDGDTGTTFDVAESIYYAIDRGADIINLSLGTSSEVEYLYDAVQEAYTSDIILVAAAGNNGGSVLYPAAYDEVISVGAHDENYQLASYSAYGPNLDLTAPGGDQYGVYSTWGYYEDGEEVHLYGSSTGTSIAAAHVSGTVALMLANKNELLPNDIKTNLKIYANKFINNYDSEKQGAGALDSYSSILEKDLGSIRVFLSENEGQNLSIDSAFEIVEVDNGTNTYHLFTEEIGDFYTAAWRNVSSDDNLINMGDYFGITNERKTVRSGYYYNNDIELHYVTDEK